MCTAIMNCLRSKSEIQRFSLLTFAVCTRVELPRRAIFLTSHQHTSSAVYNFSRGHHTGWRRQSLIHRGSSGAKRGVNLRMTSRDEPEIWATQQCCVYVNWCEWDLRAATAVNLIRWLNNSSQWIPKSQPGGGGGDETWGDCCCPQFSRIWAGCGSERGFMKLFEGSKVQKRIWTWAEKIEWECRD